MAPDDAAAYLRALRRDVETATADLRAVARQCDAIIAAFEATGARPDLVDVAILGAMGGDASHRGERAKVGLAVFAAAHPEVKP